MKLKLSTKILLGFVASATILVVVAFISVRNSRQFLETNQLVNHTHEVLYEFDQILLGTVNAETGARGFAITGDESHLEPFLQAKVSIAEHISKVRELTADNPYQQKNIDQLEDLIAPRVAHLEKYIDTRKEKGFDEARVIVASGVGKELQDNIRKVISDAQGIEQALLSQRRLDSDADARNFTIIFALLLLAIGFTLIIVYFIIDTNLKALHKAEKEAAEKNWHLSGAGELSRIMQGNKHLAELCQAIVNQVVSYLNIQTGVLYISNENGTKLKAKAAYAFDNRASFRELDFGEGIVGQAALERKVISTSDIPDKSFLVHAGFGDIRPKSILSVPISIEGKVIGVLVLGAITEFTLIQREFLQRISDSIAIAISSSQIRQMTNDLLEETQRQAEELEMQQQELRQANEELQTKTEMLENSEIELRAQQDELQYANIELEEKANTLEEQKNSLSNAKTEIEYKAKEIEATSKYKSEFLANMSHELRTPLNSILILAQLLTENRNNKLGEKESEYARNIYKSGSDLLELINEILDLSKVEAGKIDLELSDIPFRAIVDDMSSMFLEAARKKEISLTFRINIQEAGLKTDKQRIGQILKNLLANAIKFTPRGGAVSLTVDRPNDAMKLASGTLVDPSSMIAFSVTDNGIGIAADKQDLIFNAFQQADGSTKREYGGTGLGLSISRDLAGILGGEIRLTSEAGKGSTFTLYLPQQPVVGASLDKVNSNMTEQPRCGDKELLVRPLKRASTAGDSISDDRQSIGEKDRVVLIIEDDIPFANVLLDFVRQRRYKGVIATQGNTGVTYARHFKPDAILLDMKLPVLEGTEVLRQLKYDPSLRHIPVQVISSYDQRKRGLELGAFDYIRKPVSTSDLQKVFERIETFISKKLKRLLIVEDNKEQHKGIRELIGNGDVKCSSAFSGEQAIDILAKEQFDCLIVDLGLPDMSGFDLLEKIKVAEDLRQIPIIVYTAKDLSKEDNARLNKLANTVVLKTVDSHERLLDETTLFLHRIESALPKEKQRVIRNLHNADEILRNKKVLIADDDIRNIYSLTNALEDEGMICITAENGKVAVELLMSDPTIDVVLMDIMMPEMDGFEATEEIRKQEKLQTLPIIALTAKAMKGDKEKCLAVGMSDYISKPVNLLQLVSLLKVWVYK